MQRRCPECGLKLAPGVRADFCPVCVLREASQPAHDGPLLPLNLRSIGEYELQREIGRGGMGVIYLASQTGLGRQVAVKLMLGGHFSSAQHRERFRSEAQAIARLRHPNIVSIHQVGEHEGLPYFSMDYIDGGTLADLVRERPLAPPAAAEHVRRIAGAVQHAHDSGVLHRDLKPSNILIDSFGQPQVTDFGLAKSIEETGSDGTRTATGQLVGSPAYCSPEQARADRDEIGPASDVYSLGALLYHLVTGRPPFQGDSVPAVVRQVETVDPINPRRLNASIPADLENIVLKCLEKSPARRYPTARALQEDLGNFLAGRPVVARSVGPIGRLHRWARRHPGLAIAVSAVSLALIAITAGSVAAAVRIRAAERAMERHLRDSLLDQARMRRATGNAESRAEGLRMLRKIIALPSSPESASRARDELLTTLSLPDVQFHGQSTLGTDCVPGRGFLIPGMGEFVSAEDETNLVVRSIADGRILQRWELPRRVHSIVAAAPSGRHVALRHPDSVSVWDIRDGREVFMTNGSRRVVGFAKGTNWLFAEEWSNQLVVLDLDRLHEVHRLSALADDPGKPSRGLRAAALSEDNRYAAIAHGSRPLIEVFELATGRRVAAMTNGAGNVDVAWSPDGNRLAASATDARVRIWRPSDARNVATFAPLPSVARSIGFSRDGAFIALACMHPEVRIVETASFRQTGLLEGTAHHVEYDPKTGRLGTLYRNGTVGWVESRLPPEFRELTTGNTSLELVHCAASPDGRHVLSLAANGAWLTDADNARLISGLSDAGNCGAFRPVDGHLILCTPAGIQDFGMVPDRLARRREDRTFVVREAGIRSFDYSTDGRWLAWVNARNGRVALRPAEATEDSTNHVEFQHRGASEVVVSATGRWMASAGSEDGLVRVWSTATGEQLAALPSGETCHLRFSPDDRWLAVWGEGLTLFDTSNWKPSRPLPGDRSRGTLGAVTFDPTGRLLAVASGVEFVELFDLQRWTNVGNLGVGSGIQMKSLALNVPAKRLFAVGTVGRLRIWDLGQLSDRLREFGMTPEFGF